MMTEQDSKHTNEPETKQTSSIIDLFDDLEGCGCLIAFIVITCIAVSWAWGIHWLFGLLVLLFLVGR
jgi:hypothetical protein